MDYMVKTPDGNYSQVVDKGITGAKKAELSYEVLKTIDGKIAGMPETDLSLVRISSETSATGERLKRRFKSFLRRYAPKKNGCT